MSKQRITVETIRSGQPRPYADSERVVRVSFEHVPYNKTEYEKMFLSESAATDRLYGLQCGFVKTRRGGAEPFMTYLDYLTPVDKNERGAASVWEFRVVSPYTD